MQTTITASTKHRKKVLERFMQDNKEDLVATVKPEEVRATVFELSELQEAAELIKQNKLVAFPTETVYGLGANATNEQALLSIYATKRRPLSDPIIVHVLDQQQALELAVTTAEEKKMFMALTDKFWPGPLTVILKANLDKLPLVVTAGTGFVGLRSPKHLTARKLIELSGLPIGAPSANLFGHVSPTEPIHVFNDFYDQQVAVIDGERCQYGLESTVVKLTEDKLTVLRQGSFTIEKLREGLKGTAMENIAIEVVQMVKKDKELQESPGQLFRHYAPNIPCYFYEESTFEAHTAVAPLSQTVFISFSDSFDKKFKQSAGMYFRVGEQLTESESESTEAEDCFCSPEQKKLMKEVYYLLRKAENTGLKLIVIGWPSERKGPIWDKISRCTESKQIYFDQHRQIFTSDK